MERMKASDFPKEVLSLFDRYVHGGIDRREFIEKASKYAVGGMTAAAMREIHVSGMIFRRPRPPAMASPAIAHSASAAPIPTDNGSS